MKVSLHPLRIIITLICLCISFSCSDLSEEEESASVLGDGSGGTATGSNLVAHNITKATGGIIANYQYDGDVFVELYSGTSSADTVFQILSDITSSGISITISRIIGRSDTACRYQAAVLARDLDFDIEDTALKTNKNGIEFYLVQVQKADDYRNLY